VVERAAAYLDETVPLALGRHGDAGAYAVVDGALEVRLTDGSAVPLKDPEQFVGFAGDPLRPTAVLLRHNGLHVEIAIDREDPVGRVHPAGVKDVVLEAALTTIQDCEDSVAAVDAADKAVVYATGAA
jgi:malate synthase